jgi:hypothetical protein
MPHYICVRLMLIRLKQRQWLARCQASEARASADRRPQTEAHKTGESSPIKVNQGNTNSNFPHNGVASEPSQTVVPIITPSASPTHGAPPASEINGKSIKPNQGISTPVTPAPMEHLGIQNPVPTPEIENGPGDTTLVGIAGALPAEPGNKTKVTGLTR